MSIVDPEIPSHNAACLTSGNIPLASAARTQKKSKAVGYGLAALEQNLRLLDMRSACQPTVCLDAAMEGGEKTYIRFFQSHGGGREVFKQRLRSLCD